MCPVLLRHRSAVIGGAIVLFFLLVALLADFVAPYDYAERSEDLLQPPSAEHWFGTDETGRDIFSRVLYGTRISLRVGFFAITGSIIIGSFLGLIAGFYGGWRDVIISRLFDILLAFPHFWPSPSSPCWVRGSRPARHRHYPTFPPSGG